MLERSEAMKYAGDIVIAYPGRNVTDDHATGWAKEFVDMTEREARKVVDLITKRSIDPPSRAQIRQVLAEVREKTMSPAFDSSLCVFEDGVECRNCGEIHGHILPTAQVLHGLHHLRALVDGDEESRGPAAHPELCACGYQPEGDAGEGLTGLGQAVLG